MVGSAGGVLCCWDKDVFEASECVWNQKFVAVKGHWADLAGPEGFVCVYNLMDKSEGVSLFF